MSVDLQTIRDRIRELQAFRLVGDAANLADVLANPGNIGEGVAYVIAPSESAEPNKLAGVHRQRIGVTISVVYIVKAQRIGAIKTDMVEALRRTLRQKLMGFLPDGAETPLNYVSSNIRALGDAFVVTEMLFATSYQDTPA